MIRLYNNPNRKPVIGYNDETGFTMTGSALNIDPDTVWVMYHEGHADLTPDARKQMKLEVENAGKELRGVL